MEAQIDTNENLTKQVTEEDRRLALERVLTSKYFIHAPMKQKFLRLICDFHLHGRGGDLNEYLIGREVFDRDDSYNPATDPIVRVGAHGVREKLALYYQKEGTKDQLRIEIPIGSYEPIFIPHCSRLMEETAPTPLMLPERLLEPFPEPPAGARREKFWLYATIGLLVLVLASLSLAYLNLRRQIDLRGNEADQEVYQAVWEPFLKSDDQTLVVLSNPPVFRFVNNADPGKVIEHSVQLPLEQIDKLLQSLQNKQIINIIEKSGKLTLTMDTYTGIGEAIGLYQITDLFRRAGKSILMKQSRTVSAEDLKKQNVIVLGSTWVNNWSGKLPTQEVFVYNNRVAIENHDPRPGEEREYRPVFDQQTGNLTTDYALITVSPNMSDENVVMVLAGAHSEGTAAAAEFVTGKHYLNEFNRQLTQAGGGSTTPKYYQALLKVGVENGIPTTISLVSIHALRRSDR
ncbi:MAG: hypothetical protein L0220_09425 [Acidobacteria bacterium]|nr:hypothetical protein [Acidobacteriota bacterium]